MIKILMTNPYQINFEIDTINKLFDMGLDRLIISKPEFDSEALEKYIQKIDVKNHNKLILIEDLKMAERYKVAGILISKDQVFKFFYNPFIFNPFLKRNPNIEIYQKVRNVKEMDKMDSRVTRVLIYPTFIEHYKQNIIQFFDNNSLEQRKDKNILVFAMGGVTPSRYSEMLKYKFDGFVLHSTIWRESLPIERFEEFITAEKENNS